MATAMNCMQAAMKTKAVMAVSVTTAVKFMKAAMKTKAVVIVPTAMALTMQFM